MSKLQPSRRQVMVGTSAAAATFGFPRTASAATDQSQWITQLASFSIQDGKADDAVAALKKLTAAVEEHEPGVLAYIAYQEAEEPNNVVFYEIYDSPETLAAHGSQPHLRELGGSFLELFKGPIKVTKLNKVGGFARS